MQDLAVGRDPPANLSGPLELWDVRFFLKRQSVDDLDLLRPLYHRRVRLLLHPLRPASDDLSGPEWSPSLWGVVLSLTPRVRVPPHTGPVSRPWAHPVDLGQAPVFLFQDPGPLHYRLKFPSRSVSPLVYSFRPEPAPVSVPPATSLRGSRPL